MLFLTLETRPVLVFWQFLCKQDYSLFLEIRQTLCKQVLSLCLANFWILGWYGNSGALYQGSLTCNLESHAQNAWLNFVVFLTVVTPLLS
jgi:hypothetical protein